MQLAQHWGYARDGDGCGTFFTWPATTHRPLGVSGPPPLPPPPPLIANKLVRRCRAMHVCASEREQSAYIEEMGIPPKAKKKLQNCGVIGLRMLHEGKEWTVKEARFRAGPLGRFPPTPPPAALGGLGTIASMGSQEKGQKTSSPSRSLGVAGARDALLQRRRLPGRGFRWDAL